MASRWLISTRLRTPDVKSLSICQLVPDVNELYSWYNPLSSKSAFSFLKLFLPSCKYYLHSSACSPSLCMGFFCAIEMAPAITMTRTSPPGLLLPPLSVMLFSFPSGVSALCWLSSAVLHWDSSAHSRILRVQLQNTQSPPMFFHLHM